jgi:hypothetical protein
MTKSGDHTQPSLLSPLLIGVVVGIVDEGGLGLFLFCSPAACALRRDGRGLMAIGIRGP